jgi:hypothetical protein
MRHSKLPWKPVKTALNAISVRAKGGSRVCEIINDDGATLTTLMEDNAAFIAHAANCHAILLAALKFSVSVHKAQGLFDESERMAVEKAEAAIAKAEAVIAKAEEK